VPKPAKAKLAPQTKPGLLPWNDLIEKMETDLLSDTEAVQLAMYMNMSNNLYKVMLTYSILQTRLKNLLKVHPLVMSRIVYIATKTDIFKKQNGRVVSHPAELPDDMPEM
jgi:hypothetical protein